MGVCIIFRKIFMVPVGTVSIHVCVEKRKKIQVRSRFYAKFHMVKQQQQMISHLFYNIIPVSGLARFTCFSHYQFDRFNIKNITNCVHECHD